MKEILFYLYLVKPYSDASKGPFTLAAGRYNCCSGLGRRRTLQ